MSMAAWYQPQGALCYWVLLAKRAQCVSCSAAAAVAAVQRTLRLACGLSATLSSFGVVVQRIQ
jgi:hypothetical protein